MQATTVYRKTAHCAAHAKNLANIEAFDSEELADLEDTELCKGGLKYMDAEANIAGTFLLIGGIPYALLFVSPFYLFPYDRGFGATSTFCKRKTCLHDLKLYGTIYTESIDYLCSLVVRFSISYDASQMVL